MYTFVLISLPQADVRDETNTSTVTADAAFVAIGHIPNTDIVKGQVRSNIYGERAILIYIYLIFNLCCNWTHPEHGHRQGAGVI